MLPFPCVASEARPLLLSPPLSLKLAGARNRPPPRCTHSTAPRASRARSGHCQCAGPRPTGRRFPPHPWSPPPQTAQLVANAGAPTSLPPLPPLPPPGHLCLAPPPPRAGAAAPCAYAAASHALAARAWPCCFL
nr:formin-like protein 5 [Aegilops tauschii subsp. strangulata]